MNKQSYITIQGWMVQDLHLKGNLLLVYAIIYGFSQDGTGEFCGSITYLAEWLNATRQTVMNTLSELCDRKLLVKSKQIINGVQIVRYKAVIPTSVPEQPKKKQKVEIDCQSIVDDYNRTCTALPKCVKLTESRKKATEARLEEFGEEDMHRIFVKAQASSFLTGKKPGCDFRASFDWLMKPANAVKVLEGNYDDRKGGGPSGRPENAGLYDDFTI